jgi:hypothetical protein
VLNALRCQLMDPAMFQELCDEFNREMNRLRMEGRASIIAARTEVKRIYRELDKLMKLSLASLDDASPAPTPSAKVHRQRCSCRARANRGAIEASSGTLHMWVSFTPTFRGLSTGQRPRSKARTEVSAPCFMMGI